MKIVSRAMRAVLLVVGLLASGQSLAAVQFATDSYIVTQTTGPAILTVVLTNEDALTSPVTVNYNVSGGTAQPTIDYTPVSGTLVFPATDLANQTISIPILNNPNLTADATVNVQLFNAAGTSLGSIPTATVTIVPVNTASSGSIGFPDGNIFAPDTSGNVTITARRTGGASGAVSVDYSVVPSAGTAQPVTNYNVQAGTLTWANGDVADKTFTVGIVDTNAPGPALTAVFDLVNPTGGSTITSGEASTTLTIVNTNAAVPGTIQTTQPSLTVQPNAGTAVVNVSRTGGASGAATVQYITVGGSANPNQYTPVTGTLSWTDGDSSVQQILVPINQVGVSEPAGDFTVQLTSAVNASLGAPSSTDVTIAANTVNTSTISFTQQVFSVVNNLPSVSVQVTRSGTGAQIAGTASVVYKTADINAVSGTDYTGGTGTVTWNPGQTGTQNIVIPIAPSGATPQPDKYFSIVLSSPVGALLAAPETAVVDIQSAFDGQSPALLQFQTSSITTSLATGFAIVPVVRTDDSKGAVTVTANTVSGSAVAGSDFTAVTNQVLSWSDGDSSPKYVVVQLTNPSTGAETGPVTFNIQLSSPTNFAVVGPNSVATVTILPTPLSTIEFAASSYSVSDATGLVNVVLNRVGSTQGSVSAVVSTADGSAVSGTQYTGFSKQTVTWGPGDSSSRVFVITIAPPKTTPQPHTEFAVVINSLSGSGQVGSPSEAIVTISDIVEQNEEGVKVGALGPELIVPFLAFGVFRRRRNSLSR